ncbi:MAG: PD40 domain-containing protein [Desulfobacteraceae bacterium]|nr:PD40 domain-containing protein [Desulfobacteraceae bacterium]
MKKATRNLSLLLSILFTLGTLISCGGGGDDTSSTNNDTVIANGDYAYTSLDLPISIDVTANDTGGTTPYTVQIVAGPANGVANIEAGGTITYTPDNSYTGVDSFEYDISDNSTSDSASVIVGVTGAAERLNVSSAGSEADQGLISPGVDLSDNGRYASFKSSATNLVAGDNNNKPDVFIRDTISGVTSIVSPSGVADFPYTSISGDGTLVAYSDSVWNIIVINTVTSSAETIANGNGPSMSGDGRYVAFHSSSAHVLEDSNADYDIYVYDRQDAIMTRASVSSAGLQADNGSDWPVISADGSTVAFRSFASNLIATDTNNQPDVFLHKLNTAETQLVSVTSGGEQFDWGTNNQPGISADGRYVVFAQEGLTKPSGIFLRDVVAGTTIKIGDMGIDPDISADGRFIVYESDQSAPINGDTNSYTDIVIYDAQTQQSMLAIVGIDGNLADFDSKMPAISSDGKFIAFSSDATNLVAGDSNAARDVFVVENPLYP